MIFRKPYFSLFKDVNSFYHENMYLSSKIEKNFRQIIKMKIVFITSVF